MKLMRLHLSFDNVQIDANVNGNNINLNFIFNNGDSRGKLR